MLKISGLFTSQGAHYADGISDTDGKYAVSVNDISAYLQINKPFINGLNINVLFKSTKRKKWLKCRAVYL